MPPNLQTFKQKLLTGSGFVENKYYFLYKIKKP